MKRTRAIALRILLLTLLSSCRERCWAYGAGTYRALFASEYAAAEDMASSFYAGLLARLGDEKLARIGIAVVFPELTRYSYIKDVAETSALEFSYVLGGDVDFSIGKLQMKPSFATQIERMAGLELLGRFPALAQAGSSADTRAKRLHRLKDDATQLDYLAVFLLVMVRRFPEAAVGGPAAVRLLAAAYNAGPECSREDLDAAAASYWFPYGASYDGEQFSYTEIALQYYAQESQ